LEIKKEAMKNASQIGLKGIQNGEKKIILLKTEKKKTNFEKNIGFYNIFIH
jgi:hypothetical protein